VALSCAKGVINWAAAEATGSKSVTGLAFQPKAVIFFSALTDTTGAYVQDQDVMLGCATSSSQEWVIHGSSNHQAATTLSARGKSATACIRGQINGATAIDFEADFTSFNSDGFTVNLSNSPSAAVSIHYLAIGGSDVTNAKAGTFTIPTSGSPISVTDPGFQADFALFAHTFADAANLKFTMGAATSSSTDFTSHISDNTGSTTVQAARAQRGGALVSSLTNSVAINFDVAFSAFTATGFDLTISDFPAATETAYYLAIEGGQWAVGLETEGTTAAARDTSLAFDPTGLFLFGGNAINDVSFTASRDPLFSIGASDGTNEGCIWTGNDDGNTESPAAKRHDVTRAFWHADTATVIASPPAATTRNQADATLGTAKFTLTWSNAGASREFIYVAAGSAPAGDVTVTPGAATALAATAAPVLLANVATTPAPAAAATLQPTARSTIATSAALATAGTLTPTNLVTVPTAVSLATAATIAPTVVIGGAGTTVTPGPAIATAATAQPVVLVTRAATVAGSTAATIPGTLLVRVLTTSSIATAATIAPTVSIGGANVTATPGPAIAAASSSSPTVNVVRPTFRAGATADTTQPVLLARVFPTSSVGIATAAGAVFLTVADIVPAELVIVDGAQSEIVSETIAGAIVSVLDATGILVTLSDTAVVDVSAETLTGATVTITDQEH
jgi:hypothetical protein